MSNIPLFKVHMTDKAKELCGETLSSGMITQSKRVEEFEEKLKEFFDYPYILTLNSATSGLTLAYQLTGIDREYGEYVISTPLTCMATNIPIVNKDLHLVWADTDPNTCNINLEDVKKKITRETCVLTFVHWGGNPVDLDKVEEIKKYAKDKFGTHLWVIEDCAHAFGSEFNGKKLGTHGNIAVFSMQAIKHLTTGDGGLIFLPDKELYDRAKLLRWYGIDRERRSLPGSDFRLEPDIVEAGHKFHMNDINASIGIGNLENIQSIINKCVENGEYYNESLKGIPGLKLVKKLPNAKVNYWIYTIRILNGRKQEFNEFMSKNGVVVSQVHGRNDQHTCMANYKSSGLEKLPLLNELEKEIICIPVGWWVTKEDRKRIVDLIKQFFDVPCDDCKTVSQLERYDINEYRNLLKQLNGYTADLSKDFSDDYLKNIYVYKINDKIVSSAKIYIENKLYEPVAHIEDVVTDYNHRKNGYGKRIIKHLIQIAKENKCYKVVLACKEVYRPFYESCDFKKTGDEMSLYLK